MSAARRKSEEEQRAPEVAIASHDGLRALHVADIQRARILDAMMEVCAERGAAQVTVGQVVGRAGVSRRTFYELFSSGEECLLDALEQATQSLSECIAQAYGAPGRWRERVRAGLIAALAFLDHEPLVGRLLVVESLAAGPEVLRRRALALGPLIAAVDEGCTQARGKEDRGRGGPPAMVAEGVVGAVLSIIHGRMIDMEGRGAMIDGRMIDMGGRGAMIDLANPLMSMIVLPYLGPAASRAELDRPVVLRPERRNVRMRVPFSVLGIRLTYRTLCVLSAIADSPGSSNRNVGRAAGTEDQGQISKLLARLAGHGLIENTSDRQAGAAPNAWILTDKGNALQTAIASSVGGRRRVAGNA